MCMEAHNVITSHNLCIVAGKLSDLSIVNTSSEPVSHVIKLSTGTVAFDGNSSTIISDSDDSYVLRVNSASSSIDITGKGASGVFYGIQTLLALLRDTGTVPAVVVRDAPRFRFRGLFLDLSRNFRTAEEIERVMEAMVVYKLNKLHLHLADDEGWRIEINGLPELTNVSFVTHAPTHPLLLCLYQTFVKDSVLVPNDNKWKAVHRKRMCYRWVRSAVTTCRKSRASCRSWAPARTLTTPGPGTYHVNITSASWRQRIGCTSRSYRKLRCQDMHVRPSKQWKHVTGTHL